MRPSWTNASRTLRRSAGSPACSSRGGRARAAARRPLERRAEHDERAVVCRPTTSPPSTSRPSARLGPIDRQSGRRDHGVEVRSRRASGRRPRARRSSSASRPTIAASAQRSQRRPSPSDQYPASASTGPSSSSPAAKRRTLAATRSASSGTAISGVLPTCGVMMQLGSDHSGWPSGSGSGIGHVEAGAADDAVAQGVDEVVGDDVAARGPR